MSFYRITDPKKRDEMVKEYLTTMKRIQKRNLQDRIGDLSNYEDMEQKLKPVIKSNERMVEAIKKELKPNVKLEQDDTLGPLANKFRSKVLARDPDVDTSFGIRFLSDGGMAMGSEPVTIQGDDITVNGKVYDGTPGLWRLITGVTKDQIGQIDEDYTDDDLLTYVKLIFETNVLYTNFNPDNHQPRSNKSYKWKNLLKPLWIKFKGGEEGSTSGSGIQFLPSSIKELKEKLKLLLAEFFAGNTATRNEVVAILDQLRTRKVISDKEYMTINSRLA